jgi:transposase-like protein
VIRLSRIGFGDSAIATNLIQAAGRAEAGKDDRALFIGSSDLRERVTERVAAGDSVRAVARIFAVSGASVVRWSQRLRRTGSAAGGKMGPSGLHSHGRTGLAHGADRGRARGDRARAHGGTRSPNRNISCERPRSEPSTLPGNAPTHCSKPSNPANAKTTSSMQATLHPKMITV